jgi:hypothetical protein
MGGIMAGKFERRLKRRDERVVNAPTRRLSAKIRKPSYAGLLLHASRMVYLAAFAKG